MRRIAQLAALTMIVVTLAFQSAQAQFGDRRGQRSDAESQQAEAELQTAINLTRQGLFRDAIPHFLAVEGRVRDEYAASFNLALCYVGTGQFEKAAKILNDLRSNGHDTTDVENLLAQAFIGSGQQEQAFAAVQRAARLSPKDEKLYLYVSDSCMDSGYFELGLKVAELGLHQLPRSARLLFEHGMFLAQLDQLDVARQDFERTKDLAPGTDIAYIAAAQQSLFEGDVAEAVRVAREGIQKGNKHFMLLAIYGEAVMRAGVAPGQPEFPEARTALEKAVAEHPAYSSSQISLGKLYLMEDRLDEAIAHLNIGRQLDPKNPAIYSNLAAAYRRRGDAQSAQEMLAILARLNQEQVQKIGAAPGETKAGYAARVPAQSPRDR
jgi:tetratricopeptide (TPR) repeat protein